MSGPSQSPPALRIGARSDVKERTAHFLNDNPYFTGSGIADEW